jgi:hypothetical protein
MWGPPVEAFVKLRAKSERKREDEVVGEIASASPFGGELMR